MSHRGLSGLLCSKTFHPEAPRSTRDPCLAIESSTAERTSDLIFETQLSIASYLGVFLNQENSELGTLRSRRATRISSLEQKRAVSL